MIKFTSRAHEFFEDDNNHLSSSRLLVFCCFLVASAIMGKLAVMGQMTEGYFTIYLGTFTGSYVLSKKIESDAKTPTP